MTLPKRNVVDKSWTDPSLDDQSQLAAWTMSIRSARLYWSSAKRSRQRGSLSTTAVIAIVTELQELSPRDARVAMASKVLPEHLATWMRGMGVGIVLIIDPRVATETARQAHLVLPAVTRARIARRRFTELRAALTRRSASTQATRTPTMADSILSLPDQKRRQVLGHEVAVPLEAGKLLLPDQRLSRMFALSRPTKVRRQL